MCAAIDQKAEQPYEYKTTQGTLKITKTLYADDGTYMSKTRTGAQKVIGAVSDFAICTGTIVKPEKSFVYSTREGEEIKVRTTEDKESGYSRYALKEIGSTDFFRHLGNIQTAEGRTSVLNVDMYDGTKKEGIKQRQWRGT